MVWLGAGCGLRWSEAAGLTRDRIHLGARAQVTIDRQLGYRPAITRHGADTASRPLFAPPKTSASFRVIPMPATVTSALREHLRAYPPGPAGLLFTTPAGNVLNPANWRQRIWRPLVRSAPGIPAGTTFHRLRHAYASLLGDAAVPDHDIQLRLGHAHPGEIRWYRHPYPDPGDGQATRDAIDTALTEAGPAASRRLRVGFVDGKADQLLADQRAACALSQVTGHARVRRQGLEPRTRGLRVRCNKCSILPVYDGQYRTLRLPAPPGAAECRPLPDADG